MNIGCLVDGCDRKHKGRGLCELHLQRHRRTGTTDSPVKTLEQRFWSKVDRRDADECWPWSGATNDFGYGVIRPAGRRNGPNLKAHRVSAELAGMDVAGRVVRHRCDNPPCVNPRHLVPGTQAQNAVDMAERDRSVHGSRNPNARLTEGDVAAIKALVAEGITHRAIAVLYDVSRPTVTYIAQGKTWQRVEPAARDLIACVVEAITGELAA
ncbi:hypothetical protein Xcel_0567 [Xylanimonas cellulosilytica DSM 15894]|uniref:Uncharacterized protein n=1 Tax=Xylanimonas cellulosilytica (strain DSM 15894 / JCM 12276 / CECT 5975 / KCTC 9989 / LMG 20990 / NBRC 107835 / XIL07) TaxID=446471 RepID=D1BWM4_XYLCX|nr:HNH endonuclease [Xylanimonas cellulosilytica]ACZ29606.1 hypothetical protein Xcel_0567 [Xylanimonas cellulosilytica DSM 15894]